MAEPTGVALSLKLLFDGLDHKAVAAAIHQAIGDGYPRLVFDMGELEGDQWICLAASDLLQGLDGLGEEYTGDRAHLNQKVILEPLSDGIFDALSYHRDDIMDELRKEGLIREKA